MWVNGLVPIFHSFILSFFHSLILSFSQDWFRSGIISCFRWMDARLWHCARWWIFVVDWRFLTASFNESLINCADCRLGRDSLTAGRISKIPVHFVAVYKANSARSFHKCQHWDSLKGRPRIRYMKIPIKSKCFNESPMNFVAVCAGPWEKEQSRWPLVPLFLCLCVLRPLPFFSVSVCVGVWVCTCVRVYVCLPKKSV